MDTMYTEQAHEEAAGNEDEISQEGWGWQEWTGWEAMTYIRGRLKQEDVLKTELRRKKDWLKKSEEMCRISAGTYSYCSEIVHCMWPSWWSEDSYFKTQLTTKVNHPIWPYCKLKACNGVHSIWPLLSLQYPLIYNKYHTISWKYPLIHNKYHMIFYKYQLIFTYITEWQGSYFPHFLHIRHPIPSCSYVYILYACTLDAHSTSPI